MLKALEPNKPLGVRDLMPWSGIHRKTPRNRPRADCLPINANRLDLLPVQVVLTTVIMGVPAPPGERVGCKAKTLRVVPPFSSPTSFTLGVGPELLKWAAVALMRRLQDAQIVGTAENVSAPMRFKLTQRDVRGLNVPL